MRIPIALLMALALAMAAPTALAQPPDQGPGDNPPPEDPSGENQTGEDRNQTRDPPTNGTEERDENGTSGGPPSQFPGPGSFPYDPSQHFPEEGCGSVPSRPSGAPSWVPVPFAGCSGDGSE